jgi:hypothetical protein
MIRELYACPKCGSDNICKLSLIHKKGISRSSSLGITSRGSLIDVSTRSQTAASEAVRPPTKPFFSFLRHLTIGIVFSLIGFVILLFLQEGFRIFNVRGNTNLWLASIYWLFVAFLVVKVIIINSYRAVVKYRSDIIRWRNSYQCQRCCLEFVIMD